MARLSKTQVTDIIKNAPEGVQPEAIVKELLRHGHTLEGYGEAPTTQQTMPGMQPAADEKAIWDAGKVSGDDYYATKAKAVAARNKFTQSQPQASLPQLAKGAAQLTSGMAFAGPQILKGGIQDGAAALKEAFPKSKVASGTAAAVDFASNAIPVTPGELALQATGERYAGPALKAAGKALNPVAKKALGFMAEKFGGLAADTTALLETNAPAVVKYARMGADGAAEAAASAAKTVKAHIDDYVNKAGDAYQQAVDALVAQNPSYNNLRVDMPRIAGKTINKIRQDFQFPDQAALLPNLQMVGPSGQPIQAAQGVIQNVGKAASDVDLFNEFAAQFTKPMTPTQAYVLQKNLSYAIRSNAGKPIAAALGQMKKAAVDAFDATIGGTPLQGINKGYRAAMTLAEDLSKVSNADNAVTVINNAFRNKGETRDALQAISKLSPGVEAALGDMFAATAGKQVASWSRFLPNNGLAGAAMIEGINAAKHGLGSVPYVAAAGAVTSPRLYGEGFNLLSKNLPNLPRGSTTAALAALRSSRKDKK